MTIHRRVRTVGSDTYLGHWRGTPSHQHNWKESILLTQTTAIHWSATHILIKQLDEHISNLHLHIFNDEYNTQFQILQLHIFCVFNVLIFSVLTYDSSTTLTSEQLLTSTALFVFLCCLTETSKIYHLHPFLSEKLPCLAQYVKGTQVKTTSKSWRESIHFAINIFHNHYIQH